MLVIEIKTLVDITDTKVNRPRPGLQKEHDQFRNFTTLKQCVEIRSNVVFDTAPTEETIDVKDLGFGSKFKGKQKVWTFRFTPERTGAYVEGHNEIGALLADINGVPVVQNLTETINMDKAIFELNDPANKNTIIKAIKGTI
jgi:hypothetical protein